MIEQLLKAHSTLNGWVWGPVTMILAHGDRPLPDDPHSGRVQFRWLGKALREVLGKVFHEERQAEGTVTPFQAVATALASTVGVGNIAGVATAITIGGPGALFWLMRLRPARHGHEVRGDRARDASTASRTTPAPAVAARCTS